MSEGTQVGTPALNVARSGAKLAGGLLATERLNGIAVGTLVRALEKAGVPGALLESPAAAPLLRLVAPLALAQGCPFIPGLGAHQAVVQRACTLAFAAEVQTLFRPIIAELGSKFDELREAAISVDATGGHDIERPDRSTDAPRSETTS